MKWRDRQALVEFVAKALDVALANEANETPAEIARVVVDELASKYEITTKEKRSWD